MMEKIRYEIDGKEIIADKNETILSAARREGIYIPTMCYLTKVKPIASCRMCVVEMEGVDGFILSCQERAIEGAKIKTNSPALFKHRQNIMKLYDVNHPLECGVCDKSGECELQNKTLEFGVSSQEFSAKDQKREIKDWNYIQYDPSLCIMCERCVHTCNEVIGDDAITIQYGGYKSIIVTKNGGDLDCTFCGECIAVCPVGALISKDFKYTSNAWELREIPSSCAHCSSACSLFYDVKHKSVFEPKEKIYRVKNSIEYTTLCGAGRFGFDFQNEAKKDKEAFNKAILAFKEADTIKFNSLITNEEALILQKLKEKFGYKLVNKDAYSYKKFLQNFSKTSSKSLYEGNLQNIANSDYIMVLGSDIATDNPMVRYHITIASKKYSTEVIYLHPIKEALLQNVVTKYVNYEVGSEEAVLAMIADKFIDKEKLPKDIKEFFENLDIGYLSAESNFSEEELEEIVKKTAYKNRFSLIVGEDLYNHPRSENIAKILGLIEKYSPFEVTIIPSCTNTLGVSLICDLDKEEGEKIVGYNEKGDFTLSALGDGDLDMPALNQQEGTFTNIDKRVVPLNVALEFEGYCLNDIANALGLNKEFTIDYTKELPKERGFESIDFDSLKNIVDSLKDDRGYEVKNLTLKEEPSIEEVAEIESFDGTVVYFSEPVLQFNPFTAKSSIKEKAYLTGSNQFAIAAKIKEGDIVKIKLPDGKEIKREFKIDPDMKGTIARLNTFDQMEDFKTSYRYARAKIEQVGNNE